LLIIGERFANNGYIYIYLHISISIYTSVYLSISIHLSIIYLYTHTYTHTNHKHKPHTPHRLSGKVAHTAQQRFGQRWVVVALGQVSGQALRERIGAEPARTECVRDARLGEASQRVRDHVGELAPRGAPNL